MKTVVSREEIEKMVEQVKNMKGVKLVSEDVYAERIQICSECEKFEYGSTCTLCGCIMQVRARLADGRCPYPKNKKW